MIIGMIFLLWFSRLFFFFFFQAEDGIRDPLVTGVQTCALPISLRELFLFEKLSDEQLAWLAERGEVSSYPAGATVYSAGEPATRLFVLLDGTLSMSVRAGGTEIEMN